MLSRLVNFAQVVFVRLAILIEILDELVRTIQHWDINEIGSVCDEDYSQHNATQPHKERENLVQSLGLLNIIN